MTPRRAAPTPPDHHLLARERMRASFEEALGALGQGLLDHPDNHALRQALGKGSLGADAYFGQLLCLLYRLVFLRLAEARGLLHPEATPAEACKRYAARYAVRSLCDPAARSPARGADRWGDLQAVFRGLASGDPRLGLPALAGLFAPSQCPDLDRARLDDRTLLRAARSLGGPTEPDAVDWRGLDLAELGHSYEGLLALVPRVTERGRRFGFAGREGSRGNARKTSGSYYTPDALVEVLLDSALEPVARGARERARGGSAQALLDLAVVDPSCGSGHFLLAAARRLASHVAGHEASGAPTDEQRRGALRRVIERCLYGVDLNPMAVELCKVTLWLAAACPGLPLTFLDARIRHGNALLGATRGLMSEGVPDEAWAALAGDDGKVTASLRRRNRAERAGQRTPPGPHAPRRERLAHDAWCAAFLWPKADAGPEADAAPTDAAWRALGRGGGRPPPSLRSTAERLARRYALFHWELAFPEVFARGGFDVVLGNPPWERVKLQEQEFFASRDDAIAAAPTAAERKRRIAALPSRSPALWRDWSHHSRLAQGVSHFVRNAGRYPLCGKGDLNTYALFAEHSWRLLGPRGRAGFIVPSGIATDDTTKEFFAAVTRQGALRSLWELENEGFFAAGRGHMLRFALTTLSGRDDGAPETDFVFQARSVADLADPERHFTLSARDIDVLNPNTGTCPIFRTRRDAALALALYRRAGVLWRQRDPHGNPWGLRLLAMLHMTSDSALFRTRAELCADGWRLRGNRFLRGGRSMLPLYEAKMACAYNHRSGSHDAAPGGERLHRLPSPSPRSLEDPHFAPLPFYWVAEEHVEARLRGLWDRGWLLGWRNVTDARASARTTIPLLLPRSAVANSTPLMLPSRPAPEVACLYANLCSFALDYAARQKIGGLNLNYFVLKQLPVLPPAAYAAPCPWQPRASVASWLVPRALELLYTAHDLAPFARDCGDGGPPFAWNPARRASLQAEIDAAFFHLYGVSRGDAEYILGTFDVLDRAETREHGEFRSRRLVLEAYDALARAAATRRPYASPLPPPLRPG